MLQLAELVGQAGQLVIAQIQELQSTNSIMFSMLSLSLSLCIYPPPLSLSLSWSGRLVSLLLLISRTSVSFPHSLFLSLSPFVLT